MPAEQRGYVYETKRGYGIRWRDAGGAQHRRSGFETGPDARKWLRDHLDAGLRTDRSSHSRSSPTSISTRGWASRFFDDLHAPRAPPAPQGRVRRCRARRARATGRRDRRMASDAPARLALRHRPSVQADARRGRPLGLHAREPRPARRAQPATEAHRGRAVHTRGRRRPSGGARPAVRASRRLCRRDGIRPSEWCALERRDVQRAEGVVVVARTYSRGKLRGYAQDEPLAPARTALLARPGRPSRLSRRASTRRSSTWSSRPAPRPLPTQLASSRVEARAEAAGMGTARSRSGTPRSAIGSRQVSAHSRPRATRARASR